MNKAYPGRGAAVTADWLGLAAAPTFAAAALLSSLLGDGPPLPFCGAGHDGSPFGGMVPMYLLMSLFHSAPWLRLVLARRIDADDRSSTGAI